MPLARVTVPLLTKLYSGRLVTLLSYSRNVHYRQRRVHEGPTSIEKGLRIGVPEDSLAGTANLQLA